MPWSNGPLTVYHGCDDTSANNIVTIGVDLAYCKPLTDFGEGFYTTTNLAQAMSWANARSRRLNCQLATARATVVQFDIDRTQLSQCKTLGFVTEGSAPTSDYWEFVRHCRHGGTHTVPPPEKYYDVVFGLVTIWPQFFVIKDCDQISFHTDDGVNLLGQRHILATAPRGSHYFP